MAVVRPVEKLGAGRCVKTSARPSQERSNSARVIDRRPSRGLATTTREPLTAKTTANSPAPGSTTAGSGSSWSWAGTSRVRRVR